MSDSMLAVARAKNIPNSAYVLANIEDLIINEKFDLVYSLFHVMSYQTSEYSLGRALTTVRNCLNENGVAIFDFWHRAAWDNDPPVTRMTTRKNSKVEVKRISTRTIDFLTGLV